MSDSKTLAKTVLQMIKNSNDQETEKKIDGFFTYLKKKNLISLLPQIREHILRLQEHNKDHNTLVVHSRFELSESKLKEIIKLVGARDKTKIEQKIDNDLVGSFSATYQGTIYDASVKSTLIQMKKTLHI